MTTAGGDGFRSVLIGLAMLLASAGAVAGCPSARFTLPTDVMLPDRPMMIVTHASSMYDARLATKRGLDEAVRYAKSRRMPVVYLVDDSPTRHYFMDDCVPDHWVHSEGGELHFDVRSAHVYVAGGHLESCLSRTLHDLLQQWASGPARDLTVTYLMDAIYSNGKAMDERHPAQRALQTFMGIVTYGRPSGEHWPKVTMLEMMGVIRNLDVSLAFLKAVVPNWRVDFPPSYRVELQLYDANPIVLQAGTLLGPRLRFHFVDSAVTLSDG
jgi:hypothetical protein